MTGPPKRALHRALQGKGAFRRFKHELYQRHPDLISLWHGFRMPGRTPEP